MKSSKWLFALIALMACGLIAAGCGDDDETTSTAATEETSAESTTAESTTEDSTTEDSGDSANAEDVYNACIDVIEGTAAESAGQTACEQARDAFEQCATQAEATPEEGRDLAIQACQDAADQATEALQAAG
jgi:hypothetical protein